MKKPKMKPLMFKQIPFNGKIPQVQATFIAPNCFLIGDVVLKEGSSVWFGSTIRETRYPVKSEAEVSSWNIHTLRIPLLVMRLC